MEERMYMQNISELNFSEYKFTVYYAEILDQGIAEFPHRHDLYEIYYVMKGSLTINIDGTLLEIGEGRSCFLAKNIPHHVLYNPGIPKRYFALIFDVTSIVSNSHCGPDGMFEFHDVENALARVTNTTYLITDVYLLGNLLYEYETELYKRALGWNSQLVHICFRFFILSIRQIAQESTKDTSFSGKVNLAMSVSKYIHQHYHEKMSVERVAEALNVTPRHINRAYKEMFSTTLMKNTNLLRIAYAKDYLCKTDLPIEEIAERIGFASSRALYKLFKEYEGISIASYRQAHKRESES